MQNGLKGKLEGGKTKGGQHQDDTGVSKFFHGLRQKVAELRRRKGGLGAVEESTGQNTAPIAQSSVNASSPTPAGNECEWIFGGLAAVIACGHRRCGA